MSSADDALTWLCSSFGRPLSRDEGDRLLALWKAGFAQAGRDWPTFAVDERELAEHVAAKLDPARAPHEALADLRLPDLYVALACSRGDHRAAHAFHLAFFPSLDGPLMRVLGGRREAVDEVKQRVRTQLLVPAPGRPTPLAEYGGRGDMQTWLRVTAVRAALKLLRSERGATATPEEELNDFVLTREDPELERVRAQLQPRFREALRTAVARLTDRNRLLLKQHYVDGLGIDHLATLYDVHRSTAARWLDRIRQQLREELRRELQQNLDISQSSCDSLLLFMASDLRVTLTDWEDP